MNGYRRTLLAKIRFRIILGPKLPMKLSLAEYQDLDKKKGREGS